MSVLRLSSHLQGLGLRISLLSQSNYDKCLKGWGVVYEGRPVYGV